MGRLPSSTMGVRWLIRRLRSSSRAILLGVRDRYFSNLLHCIPEYAQRISQKAPFTLLEQNKLFPAPYCSPLSHCWLTTLQATGLERLAHISGRVCGASLE